MYEQVVCEISNRSTKHTLVQFEDRSVECHTIAELCNVYPDEAPKPQYTSNIWETSDMSEDEDDEEFCIKAPAACGVKRATRSNTQVYL